MLYNILGGVEMDNFITKHRKLIAKTLNFLFDIIGCLVEYILFINFGFVVAIIFFIPLILIDIIATKYIYKKLIRRQV